VTWGTLQVPSNPKADIIYHKGDIGKEAMITVFGKNLGEVAVKIKEILKNYWTLLAAPESLRVTPRVTQSHSESLCE
jgi:Thiamine-phosphate synthase